MPAAAESPGRPPVTRTQRTVWSFASGLGHMGPTIGVSLIVTPWPESTGEYAADLHALDAVQEAANLPAQRRRGAARG